jgi:hypothetical protein
MTELFGLHGITRWIIVAPYATPNVSFSSELLLKPRLCESIS